MTEELPLHNVHCNKINTGRMKCLAVRLKTHISTSLSCFPLSTPDGVFIEALPSNELHLMASSGRRIVRVLCFCLD